MIKVFLSRQRQAVLTAGIILNQLHGLLWLKQSQQTQFLAKCGANRFHKLQLLFWIKRCSGKEKFLDLKQYREVHILKEGFQNKEMRSVFIQNKHTTSSAVVLCGFYDLNKVLEVRTNGGCVGRR